jgi:hypothetical protein
MQQILIDIARRKQRLKHGAYLVGDELHESRIAMSVPSEELLAINDALATLALEDPQAAQVVQMRYFVGMTVPEIAAALDLSPRTVDRHGPLPVNARSGHPFRRGGSTPESHIQWRDFHRKLAWRWRADRAWLKRFES